MSFENETLLTAYKKVHILHVCVYLVVTIKSHSLSLLQDFLFLHTFCLILGLSLLQRSRIEETTPQRINPFSASQPNLQENIQADREIPSNNNSVNKPKTKTTGKPNSTSKSNATKPGHALYMPNGARKSKEVHQSRGAQQTKSIQRTKDTQQANEVHSMNGSSQKRDIQQTNHVLQPDNMQQPSVYQPNRDYNASQNRAMQHTNNTINSYKSQQSTSVYQPNYKTKEVQQRNEVQDASRVPSETPSETPVNLNLKQFSW